MKAAAGTYFRALISRSRASIAVLASFAFLGACGKNTGNVSELFHDANDPTHSTLGYQWGIVGDNDYLEFVAPLIRISDNFLPQDNALTLRVQTWIDRFDANLRSKNPEQMIGVPKPKARIILNPSMNAFIAPVPVCHDIEIRFKERSEKPSTEQIFFDITGGSFELWPSEEIACMPAKDDLSSRNEVAAAMREFNLRAPKGCKITLEKDGDTHFIAPNKACDTDQDLGAFSGSKKLVLLSTADWVNIYAGLITELEEQEVAGVIAHELGHYYRSHVTAPSALYGLFYQAEKDVLAVRPNGVSSLGSLGKSALASTAMIDTMERFKRVPHQKIHSALFMATGEMALAVCKEDKSCSKACSQLSKETETDDFKQATYLFPLRELNAEGLKGYSNFEELAIECLADIPLETRDEVRGQAMSWDDVLYKIASPSWPGWIETDVDVRLAMRRWLRKVSALLPDKAPKGAKDVAGLLKSVSTHLWDEEEAAIKTIQKAYDEHLGYYTDEQEADELGTEWLNDLGLNPKSAVETYLSFGKWMASQGSKPSASLLETPAEECQNLYDNGWLDSAGKFKFVAIGNFTDPHHHTCYRAFNVDREIRAHKYKFSGNGKRGLLSASGWHDLQKIAEEATADDAVDGSVKGIKGLDGNLSREIKRAAGHASKFVHSGCSFSPF